MKYFLLLLFFLVTFIGFVILVAYNDQVISVNYLIAQGDYRLSILLVTLFGAGFLFGWVICGPLYLRAYIRLGHAERKIKRLTLQLSQFSKKIT